MGLLDRVKGRGTNLNVGPRSSSLPTELMWLADAPLFIDETRVDAFYDAVFRPDYGQTSLTLQEKVSRDTKLGGEFTLGSLIPGLFAKADAKLTGGYSRGRERGQETAWQPISNPYRHLLALALHYSTEKRGRLVLARTPAEGTSGPGKATDGAGRPLTKDWLLPHSEFIRKTPRAMIMLDLEPGCKAIPAAVELSNGVVKPLFENLEAGFRNDAKTPPPKYPGSHSDLTERNRYWEWFAVNFKDRVALDVVERAVDGQKIQWIAYRISFGDDTGPYFHFTFSARGAFDTVVFGYNLINRGTKHGLRVVGTLKSEPDIDVLALFER
jgi:hypothetical protein